VTGWWLVSFIALWICVIVIGVLLLVVLRQVGLIYLREERAAGTSRPKIWSVGDLLDPMSLEGLLDGERIELPDSNSRLTLLLFLSTDCAACRDLMPAVPGWSADSRLRVVLATRNEVASLRELQSMVSTDSAGVIDQEIMGPLLGAQVHPWAAVVSPAGEILASEPVGASEDVDAMVATSLGDAPSPLPLVIKEAV
jgi:hypothetical protein